MSQDPRIGAEPADFLFDTEELHALADGALIKKALRHAHDNRVTRVALVDGELVATVEDEDQEEQLDLRLGYDADGNLWSSCDCGDDSGICLHGLGRS